LKSYSLRPSQAFNYARDKHTTTIESATSQQLLGVGGEHHSAVFRSNSLTLQLIAISDCDDAEDSPTIRFETVTPSEHALGPAARTVFTLKEGQKVSFILREFVPDTTSDPITSVRVSKLQHETEMYWFRWISQSTYMGRWREIVSRSLLILKLLTYEPTGAIVAAPTFSLPEDFGGTRNWDYRFSWVRDSSFTIYILLRMGFKAEAEAYMNFISDRMRFSRLPDGSLPIMFSTFLLLFSSLLTLSRPPTLPAHQLIPEQGIHGSTELEELELSHLSGHRDSKPVRIGNGAATHKQLDIYGELMDGIYLYNKYGKPVSYDQWLAVRSLTDYVCTAWSEPDMSIWEVRGRVQNFVYSKIMLWVAVDRALRLAEKRMFPCPQRLRWMAVRDEIYEEIMDRGYNQDMGAFVQSYESNDMLDSAVLIAPLVFFIAPNDPRFTRTLEWILKPPEQGGLTSAGLVYRYNWRKSEDGECFFLTLLPALLPPPSIANTKSPISHSKLTNPPPPPSPGVGGREGAFSMCTFWLVEALVRAGAYDTKYLAQAIRLFENMLGCGNHLHMFSEEIARSGEQLGNTPQAFSHLALIR
jgi:GH15 family glucan-1,4-alpha-glucosidase